MIRSMTGFGRGEYSDGISKVTVEIKSVNHRYLDIYVKMPRRYSFAEETIKGAVKERLHRGKVEVSVNVDNIGKSDSDVRLDRELAAKYYDALSTLHDSFDFGDESRVSLSLLSKMPDVIVTTPAAEDEEQTAMRFISRGKGNVLLSSMIPSASSCESISRRRLAISPKVYDGSILLIFSE
jgi:uncharacterized protein (TIGR00255 family)